MGREERRIASMRTIGITVTLAITSTEKQAETMAYSKPLNPKMKNFRSFTVDGTEIQMADTTIGEDVVGVDGISTHSVVPAVAYYPSDLDSFGDGNVTYLWPRHKWATQQKSRSRTCSAPTDITPFDIGKFLALMEHAEVKAALFKLIDERERKNDDR